MQDFISATSSGDATKAAEAFKAAFSICESEPHYEDHSMNVEEDTE